jgi:hypothetical protein
MASDGKIHPFGRMNQLLAGMSSQYEHQQSKRKKSSGVDILTSALRNSLYSGLRIQKLYRSFLFMLPALK